MDRRQFVVVFSAGMGTAALRSAVGQTQHWRFLTDDEARLLDAVAEQIIPADQDAGAHDAGVVNFMDRQLVGHYRRDQDLIRRGLVGLQETCQALFQQGFVELPWQQQTHVLKQLEAGTAPGATWQRESASEFFRRVRDYTLQGFYGSPRHGGNRRYVSYRMLGLDYPQLIGRPRPGAGRP